MGLASPTGRALLHAIQSTRENADVRRTVDTVIGERVALVQRGERLGSRRARDAARS